MPTSGFDQVLAGLDGAVACLGTAGTALIGTRRRLPPEAQELVTAIRDQVGDLIKDVEAVKQLVR